MWLCSVGGVSDGGCGHAVREGWSRMECVAFVGGARNGMWEGPGMEGVGGARDGVWEGPGMECGRGQGWRVWEGSAMEGVGGYSFSLQSNNYLFWGIPGFHNLYINP